MNRPLPSECPVLCTQLSKEIAALTIEEMALEDEKQRSQSRLNIVLARQMELLARLNFLRDLELSYQRLTAPDAASS